MVEPKANTVAFKFLGMHFTSTKNRNRKYSFKSDWKVQYEPSWYHKLDYIFSGHVRRMKGV